MALDMYLEARCSVAPGDATLAPTRKAISDAIGYVAPMAKPINDPASLEVSAVMVRLGYWRTFWPLHYWFVNNLQEGNDDIHAYINHRDKKAYLRLNNDFFCRWSL